MLLWHTVHLTLTCVTYHNTLMTLLTNSGPVLSYCHAIHHKFHHFSQTLSHPCKICHTHMPHNAHKTVSPYSHLATLKSQPHLPLTMISSHILFFPDLII